MSIYCFEWVDTSICWCFRPLSSCVCPVFVQFLLSFYMVGLASPLFLVYLLYSMLFVAFTAANTTTTYYYCLFPEYWNNEIGMVSKYST